MIGGEQETNRQHSNAVCGIFLCLVYPWGVWNWSPMGTTLMTPRLVSTMLWLLESGDSFQILETQLMLCGGSIETPGIESPDSLGKGSDAFVASPLSDASMIYGFLYLCSSHFSMLLCQITLDLPGLGRAKFLEKIACNSVTGDAVLKSLYTLVANTSEK